MRSHAKEKQQKVVVVLALTHIIKSVVTGKGKLPRQNKIGEWLILTCDRPAVWPLFSVVCDTYELLSSENVQTSVRSDCLSSAPFLRLFEGKNDDEN